MKSLLKYHYKKVYFYLLDVINTCDEPKTKQRRLRLKSKSSPQVEKYEPSHRRKKKRVMGMIHGYIGVHGSLRPISLRLKNHLDRIHHECLHSWTVELNDVKQSVSWEASRTFNCYCVLCYFFLQVFFF